MTNETPTPRTDAHYNSSCYSQRDLDFARQLERELAKAKAEIAELGRILKQTSAETELELKARADKAEKLAHKLMKALEIDMNVRKGVYLSVSDFEFINEALTLARKELYENPR